MLICYLYREHLLFDFTTWPTKISCDWRIIPPSCCSQYQQARWHCWSIFNTLRLRWNGGHFADVIFKCTFLSENVWISIKIWLKFVPEGAIDNIPALVEIMAWHRPGDKPLSEPMMVSLLTHICVTWPRWVKFIELVQTFDFNWRTVGVPTHLHAFWISRAMTSVIMCPDWFKKQAPVSMFNHDIYSKGSNFVQFELSYQVATERYMTSDVVELSSLPVIRNNHSKHKYLSFETLQDLIIKRHYWNKPLIFLQRICENEIYFDIICLL